MKRKVLIPVMILLLMVSFAASAYAQSVSDVSYTLTVNGAPVSETEPMVVHPGDTLNFRATASFTYHGPSVTPEVSFTGDFYLSQNGVIIDHPPTISRNLGSMPLADGQHVTIDSSSTGGDITYTVPATARGTCLLKMVATAHADVKVLGQTIASAPPQTDSVIMILDVVVPTPSDQPTPTPAPSPTPLPETNKTYSVNDNTVQTNLDGTKSFETQEVTATVTNDTGASTTVAASVDVNLSQLPAGGGQLTTYVESQPDPAAATQFMLAAANAGGDIRGIACVLVVDKTNLANGKEIKNATITMKVSQAWVNANGGPDAIKIIRYSEGTAETLDTWFAGMDGDLMVFQALSPHGLSQFALAAVTKLPETPAETAAGGASVNMGLIIGAVVALLIILGAVIAIAYTTLNKRKGNK